MERFKALSTGPKLLLVATPLLFASLFFTWQKLEVDFGRAGRAEALLDGWDFWGLLIGLLQALTSVQEMTLTFVPKLAAMIGVFWVTMAFMTATLVDFFQGSLMPMVAGG